jgi:NarL family two-component system response regulator LiaR
MRETGVGDAPARQGAWRIVVADDHPPYRQAIRQTLESQADLEVVAEASDGRQALELCRVLAPDLVLMDLVMPVMDGVGATRLIKREYPNPRVLVLTALNESSSLSECIKAGAEGYILKDAPAERLIDAVRAVLSGGSPLDEGLATELLMSLVDRKSNKKE